jgi:sulfofructose kinase
VAARRIKRVDVVGVGLNATDTVIQVPHFPAFNSKVQIISSSISAGGQVASAMVACQLWGLRTRYVGKIGNDAAGALQRSEMVKASAEAHFISVADCPSQGSFILVDKSTGERTVLWQRDPRMALRPGELRREWIVSGRALLVDGHDTAAAACAARWARAAGMPVTADLDNLYPGVEKLLEHVDFVITSREFPARLTGEKDLLKALRLIHRKFKNRIVGATLGCDGVIVWDGVAFHYCPAFRVDTVDTTGAGDVFHAAFVYAQLAGWKIAEQLEFSCAAAALNCTKIGARGGIASLGKIRRMIRDGKKYPRAFRGGRFKS